MTPFRQIKPPELRGLLNLSKQAGISSEDIANMINVTPEALQEMSESKLWPDSNKRLEMRYAIRKINTDLLRRNLKYTDSQNKSRCKFNSWGNL